MRLRKAMAGAAAGLALFVGGALLTPTGPAAAIPTPPAGTIRADVGQLVLLGFEGTAAPAWQRSVLRRRAAAGVILFGANVRSRAQLRGLTGSLQRASGGTAIVSVDQEGGTVRRLSWLGPSAQPAQHSAARARGQASTAGRGLHRVGVNLNLAPVADVAVGQSAMRPRAFPGGPSSVASLTAAAVRGYSAAGVGSTAKH